ncbi:MAG: hypothetical protein QW405_03525, partial [Fervidicoccaceae archaeon]
MVRTKLLKLLSSECGAADLISTSFDLVGDIIILRPLTPLRDPLSLEERLGEAAKCVAERLLARLPYVKSVHLASTPIEGEYRTRKLIYLAGERRTLTIYREHGCSFVVDVERTFVTPRLSFERRRVAELVRAGEVVVNMFAGTGLFSVLIAKLSRPKVVYSIDKSPLAYSLMVENVKLNSVEGVVVPLLGDCREIIRERLRGEADRVLMPLPSFSASFYEHAIEALREEGGIIHAYEFVKLRRGE